MDLPPQAPVLAYLNTPEGAKGGAMLINGYAALLKRHPVQTAFASGVVVTLAFFHARKGTGRKVVAGSVMPDLPQIEGGHAR
jgi:hypothetical protein